jgi:hypothetical protein
MMRQSLEDFAGGANSTMYELPQASRSRHGKWRFPHSRRRSANERAFDESHTDHSMSMSDCVRFALKRWRVSDLDHAMDPTNMAPIVKNGIATARIRLDHCICIAALPPHS